VISLLCYFLCAITVLTAVAVGMISLSEISNSERAGHYPHPRPAVERNDRELRLFMVVPKTKHGSPANKEAHSAAVPAEEVDGKKRKPHKPKVLARQHNNYGRPDYWNTPGDSKESPNGPSSLFSTGDPDRR